MAGCPYDPQHSEYNSQAPNGIILGNFYPPGAQVGSVLRDLGFHYTSQESPTLPVKFSYSTSGLYVPCVVSAAYHKKRKLLHEY